jgi:Hemerythrin HHE cation binding domain.
MIFTEKLRRQHEDTKQLINEISTYLTVSSLDKNSQKVRSLLSTLIGKANVHRASEDNYLYPKMLKHDSKELRAVAEKYYEGFINAKDVLSNYSTKWAAARKIAENPNEFIEDSKVIFSKISDRIDKENNELFRLADEYLK